MLTDSGTLVTFDGLTLHYEWERPSSPRAAIVIVHGLGDHMHRYGPLCASLTDHGFAIYRYDQRGHGQSEGRPTDVERFGDYTRDLDRFLTRVRELEPDLGLFVFAHSLGSVIALHALIRHSHDIRGLVVSGYPCRLAAGLPYWQRLIARVAAGLLPGVRVGSRLEPEQLSHDPDVVEAYARDELVGRTVTLRWLGEFLSACEQLQDGPLELPMPVLVLHGESDGIAAAGGARELAERLATPDTKLMTYPGLKHELHNEPGEMRARYLGDLQQWLDAHLQ